ncbi:Mur ligase family protein, partial [Faecalibaculum rodentium]
MTLSEKIAALESRTGINRPVKQLRSLMQQYIPETLKIPAIQVAGTNGKGSTVTWMSLLADRPVIGTFTSPHMFSHFERMTINNQPIPADQWEAIYDRWLPLFEEQDFTMFEADLWMAMVWFAEKDVDLMLMETGLGGERDATTALDYLATGITNIGRDHMQYLGSTLEEIAKAKAGIFKPGIPAL